MFPLVVLHCRQSFGYWFYGQKGLNCAFLDMLYNPPLHSVSLWRTRVPSLSEGRSNMGMNYWKCPRGMRNSNSHGVHSALLHLLFWLSPRSLEHEEQSGRKRAASKPNIWNVHCAQVYFKLIKAAIATPSNKKGHRHRRICWIANASDSLWNTQNKLLIFPYNSVTTKYLKMEKFNSTEEANKSITCLSVSQLKTNRRETEHKRNKH